jgi:hypothetical protein
MVTPYPKEAAPVVRAFGGNVNVGRSGALLP